VESSVYDTRRVIQTDHDIFWIDKFTGNVLDYNEQDFAESY